MAQEWDGRGSDIQLVVDKVKWELARAAGAAPDLQLDEVELELSVVTKRETAGEAKLSFKVPFLGSIGLTGSASRATEGTTKLKLTYAAPKRLEFEGLDVDLSGLKGALATIQSAIHAADRSDPRLKMKEGEISFAFGVTEEVKGKVEIVILEGTRTGSRADEQTITLKFEPK